MILSFVCQKGGVAKTTSALCYAAALRNKGHKTLLVDLDAQCSLTLMAGATRSNKTITDILDGEAAAVAIQATEQYGDIIPGSKALVGADAALDAAETAKILKNLSRNYDYTIIDTPPAVSVLTLSTILASDKIVIPAGADTLSYQAIVDLHDNLDKLHAADKVAGVLITRYAERRCLARELLSAITGYCDGVKWKLYNTKIHEGVAAQEIAAMRQNIYTYAPTSKQAQEYAAAVDEFLKEAQKNG